MTPYTHCLRVFYAAGPPKEFWPMRHPHGQMIVREPDVYTAKVRGWLDAALGHTAPVG